MCATTCSLIPPRVANSPASVARLCSCGWRRCCQDPGTPSRHSGARPPRHAVAVQPGGDLFGEGEVGRHGRGRGAEGDELVGARRLDGGANAIEDSGRRWFRRKNRCGAAAVGNQRKGNCARHCGRRCYHRSHLLKRRDRYQADDVVIGAEPELGQHVSRNLRPNGEHHHVAAVQHGLVGSRHRRRSGIWPPAQQPCPHCAARPGSCRRQGRRRSGP